MSKVDLSRLLQLFTSIYGYLRYIKKCFVLIGIAESMDHRRCLCCRLRRLRLRRLRRLRRKAICHRLRRLGRKTINYRLDLLCRRCNFASGLAIAVLRSH
ncbi:uncharacterized protein [Aegilops tauschii subsp. strangulata]|uniref:uncharacterized protein isoform X3 n=1 Tax=Aegilops tauschii subsp. strangulata TaxID=200361 RepID=UPI003CC8A21A